MLAVKSALSVFRVGLICLLLTALSACGPVTKAVIEERAVLSVRQQTEGIGGQVVRVALSGDTLYRIAFEHNLDVNKLAAWNDMVDSSRLFIGQRVRLTKPIGFVEKKRKAQNLKKTPQTKRVEPTPSKKIKPKPKPKPVLGKNTPKVPRAIVQSDNRNDNIRWSWPFIGKVIRRFSPSSTQQGIDILGDNGQVVRASAAGEVVYVGDSLKGYGNLIIIKHNDSFLSAYAHNKKIMVTENQEVLSNQVIGTVGTNNYRENALHFQIRKHGKPVNPLSYLPGK